MMRIRSTSVAMRRKTRRRSRGLGRVLVRVEASRPVDHVELGELVLQPDATAHRGGSSMPPPVSRLPSASSFDLERIQPDATAVIQGQ